MIDGQNFFDQPVKNNLRTYDNIRKIATGRQDGYTTSFLLDYNYFNEYYKMIEIDLSKHKHIMLIQKNTIINFRRSLTRHGNGNTTMFFVIEKVKEAILDFLQETVKVFWIYFTLI